MAEVLNVQLRQTRGKRNARRLRLAGSVPAVLYGHGEEVIALSVSAEELDTAIRRGSRLVNLEGGVSQQALVRELQWDTWGTHVLHADFTRISADEKIEVEIAVEIRGEAPGVRAGGVVEHPLHSIRIECLAMAIPEKVTVNINQLNLGDTITAGDLKLPESAKLLTAPEKLAVQCVEPAVLDEDLEGEAAEVEPEVIGRKKEEEENE